MVVVNKSGDLILIQEQNALPGRTGRFRFRAGAIPWVRRQGSAEIRVFIDSFHAQQRPGRIGNNTRACQDLTAEQIAAVKVIIEGKYSKPTKKSVAARGKALHQ